MTLLAVPAGLIVEKLTAGLLSVVLAGAVGSLARDEIRAQQWHLEFLSIEQAHEISTGEGVIVGVVDTGVDGRHPDLAGSLLPGTDLSVLDRVDGLEDLDGHGTAMAGIIVAHGRTLGIAPDATILPVRRGADAGTTFSDKAAMGIEYAVDHGATVLCLAFGFEQVDSYLEEALDYALANDVVVVAGVGNTPYEHPQYPAAYPGVLGVAGVDRDGNHGEFSVVGPSAMIAAPAVDIMTPRSRTVVPGGYGAGSGTSDATAIVAGVAALVRAEYPELSAADVINRITATADDRGAPGRDDEYGYGIVNPVAALTADVPPLEPTGTPSPEPTRSDAGPRRLVGRSRAGRGGGRRYRRAARRRPGRRPGRRPAPPIDHLHLHHRRCSASVASRTSAATSLSAGGGPRPPPPARRFSPSTSAAQRPARRRPDLLPASMPGWYK